MSGVAGTIPCARATRGRRLPSLDARNWDHPSHPFVSDGSLLGGYFEHSVGLFICGATMVFSGSAEEVGY